MSRRLYSHKRIKYWHTYDIEEICQTFSYAKLHEQTVRRWVKNGLKTIDRGKPVLIYGYDLIEYLKKHNNKNKYCTEFDNMFCMKCQDARPILRNKVQLEHKNGFLMAKGYCRECKTLMYKSYKVDDYPQLKKNFSLVDVLQLYDCNTSASKTQIDANINCAGNESLQMEMFQL